MSPSPIREEYHRWTRVSAPLTTARTATTSERRMTTARFWGTMPSSTMDLSSSGVATTRAALTTTSTRKTAICCLYGRAYCITRRVVPGASWRPLTLESLVRECITCHPPMLTSCVLRQSSSFPVSQPPDTDGCSSRRGHPLVPDRPDPDDDGTTVTDARRSPCPTRCATRSCSTRTRCRRAGTTSSPTSRHRRPHPCTRAPGSRSGPRTSRRSSRWTSSPRR